MALLFKHVLKKRYLKLIVKEVELLHLLNSSSEQMVCDSQEPIAHMSHTTLVQKLASVKISLVMSSEFADEATSRCSQGPRDCSMKSFSKFRFTCHYKAGIEVVQGKSLHYLVR